MESVNQTKFGKENGNCWAACIASILEVSLDKVPNFCVKYAKKNDWWKQTQAWIEEHSDYSLIEVDIPVGASLSLFGNSYWIASGKSPRGDFDHSVVYHGDEMIHDPHPDKTGLDGFPRNGAFFTLKGNKKESVHGNL